MHLHVRMAGWRQRLEQHTSCVTEELEEEDGIHTIEREACSRESDLLHKLYSSILIAGSTCWPPMGTVTTARPFSVAAAAHPPANAIATCLSSASEPNVQHGPLFAPFKSSSRAKSTFSSTSTANRTPLTRSQSTSNLRPPSSTTWHACITPRLPSSHFRFSHTTSMVHPAESSH